MGKKHITLLVGITILLSGVFAGAYFLNHSIKRQLSQIVTTHKPGLPNTGQSQPAHSNLEEFVLFGIICTVMMLVSAVHKRA